MKRFALLGAMVLVGGLLLGANYSSVNRIDNAAQTRVSQASDNLISGTTLIAVGTVPTQIYSTTGLCVQGVYLSTLTANTKNLYVGLSTIGVGTGYNMESNRNVFVPVNDPSVLYAITSTASTAAAGSYITYMFAY
jgi:hypothetical protein